MVSFHSIWSYSYDFNCHRFFRSFCFRSFCFRLSSQGMLFDRLSNWSYIELLFIFCSFFDRNFHHFWRKFKRTIFLIWLDDSFKLWALQRLPSTIDTRQNYMLASLLGFFLAIDVMVLLSVVHSLCHHLRFRSLGMEKEMALASLSPSPLQFPWVHQLLPLPLKKVDKVKNNNVKNSVKHLYGKKRP